MQNRSLFQSFFHQYERDIASMASEMERLRQENVELNLSAYGKHSDLRRQLQRLTDEREDLKKQIRRLEKHKRQSLMNEKLVDVSSKNLLSLNRQVHEMDSELLSNRLGTAKTSAELHRIRLENSQLRKSLQSLQSERDNALEELLSMKMYLSTVEQNQRQHRRIDEFVHKHGILPQKGLSVKKTSIKQVMSSLESRAPDVVPTLSKLEHEIEDLEAVVSDYKSREKDFVQLLVNASSDKPQLSLKDQLRHDVAALL